MLKLACLIVGLSLVTFFTVRFVLSLTEGGHTRSKVWKWIKHVVDAISGVG
jgi:uncharacterized membrane protein SirB2